MTAQAARALRPRGAGAGCAQRPATQTRPVLSVVHAWSPSRSTLPFLGLVISLLLAALGVALLLNAFMASTAGNLQRTREAASEARESAVVLQSQLDQRRSSAALAERARSLGMVPAETPGLVDLGSGSVTAGKPAPSPTAAAPQPAESQLAPQASQAPGATPAEPAAEAQATAVQPPAPTSGQTP